MYVETNRTLNGTDLERLSTEPLGVKSEGIKRLRDSHHRLARTLARGVKDVEASAICGYSPSRISILRKDPTFSSLISFYRGRIDAEFTDVAKRLATLSADAVQELQLRLDENGEEIPVGTLIEIAKLSLDRSGHGPQRKVDATLTLTPEELNHIKREVIDLEPVDSTQEALPAPD